MERNFERTFTFRNYLEKTYATLGLGLGITTLVAFVFSLINPMILYRMYFVLVIAQLGLAFFFGMRLMSMSKQTAWICYIAYSVLMGMSLSSLVYVYTGASIVMGLATTTVLFVCLAFIGRTTSFDLSKLGGLAIAGLMAIIVISLLNSFFFHAAGLELVICYISIILFMVITAYDVQRLQRFYQSGFADGEFGEKMVIYGAFQLYLDFINLFLRILQLFGRRRNN